MSEIKWRKVKSSTRWNPQQEGEELVGIYKGSRVGDGVYGVYTAHFVLTEHGVKTITGCVIDQLFAAIPDHTNKSVKVVFNGRKEFSGPEGDSREMKLYELYVEE